MFRIFVIMLLLPFCVRANDYMPVKIGNQWIYEDGKGNIDTMTITTFYENFYWENDTSTNAYEIVVKSSDYHKNKSIFAYSGTSYLKFQSSDGLDSISFNDGVLNNDISVFKQVLTIQNIYTYNGFLFVKNDRANYIFADNIGILSRKLEKESIKLLSYKLK